MMKRAVGIFLFLALATAVVAGDFSLDKAKKIDGFLVRIAAPRPASLFLKKMTFNESELNSYLNLIYTKKYAPEVSFIEMRLKDKNRIDGNLKVKLAGEKYKAVPESLRDTAIRFSGKFDCSNHHMRFVFSELVINGNRFSPDVLDELFGAAQFNVKVKKSIFDWFTLLPGLKNVQSSEKTIYFYY